MELDSPAAVELDSPDAVELDSPEAVELDRPDALSGGMMQASAGIGKKSNAEDANAGLATCET